MLSVNYQLSLVAIGGGGGGVKGGTDGRKFISNSSSLSHVTLVKIRTFTFTLLDT